MASFQLGKIHTKLTLDIKSFQESLDQASRSTKEFEANFKKMTNNLGKKMRGVFGATKKLGKEFGQEITKQMRLIDKSMAGVIGTVNKMGDRIQNAGRKGSQSMLSLKGAMNAIGKAAVFSVMYKSIGTLIQGIQVLTKEVLEYEQAMKGVQAVLQETSGSATMKVLDRAAKQLAASTIFTQKQVAEGMELMARSSMKASEIVAAMPKALQMATAGGLDFAEGTNIMINTLKAFNMEAKDSQKVADTMAFTTANYKTNMRELGTAMNYVGGEARGLNVPMREVAAAIGVLSDRGISASRAGTTLRRVIFGLNKDTAKTRGILKQVGLEVKDIATTQTGSLIASFNKMRKTTLSMNKILEVFGIRGMAGAAAFFELADAMAESVAMMDRADGIAQKMAATMQDSVSAQLKILWSEITRLATAIADPFPPMIKEIIATLSEMVSALTSAIEGWTKFFKFIKQNTVGTAKRIDAWVGQQVDAWLPPEVAKALKGSIGKINEAAYGASSMGGTGPLEAGRARMKRAASGEDDATLNRLAASLDIATKKQTAEWSDLKQTLDSMGGAETWSKQSFAADLRAKVTAETEKAMATPGYKMDPKVMQQWDALGRLGEMAKKAPGSLQGDIGKYRPAPKPASSEHVGSAGAKAASSKKEFNMYVRQKQRLNKLHQDEFNMLKASQKVEWQRFQNATRNLSQDQKSRMEIEKRYTMQKELIAAEKDMIQKKLQNAQDVLQKAKELNNVEGVQKAEIMIEQLEIQKEKVEHEDDYVESVYEGTKGINEQRIALEEFNKEMEKKQKEFSHAQEVRGLEHAISEQGMIQQGKSPTAIAQAEFDHKKEMIDLERQHTTERMKNLAADINKNNYQGDILEKKMEELEALGMENELLGKRKQLLEAEEMTFQMQDQLQMAEDFATNITDSITAIGDAMRGNIEDMAAAFDQMGKKFMEDALKPSLKQIQDSMRELFMKMGKWTGTAVMAGIGIAFTAISSFLKKQKAEVESLADEAEEGIVEGERVRGVVAGDNQIAVAKIRDNMKDALRQTNGILTSIDAAVWKTAGGSSIAGGEEVPTQSENNQTQGGFARESIAGARV